MNGVLNAEVVNDVLNAEVVNDILNAEVVNDILNAEVVNDILNAEAVAKQHLKPLSRRGLLTKLKFHASLPRQSLKTFGSLKKTKKLKSSKLVQISAQRNLFGQLLILSEDNNLSLQNVLHYPLDSSLATPGGLLVKTDKAKLMHQLEDDAALVHHPCLDDLGAHVVDGNALVQALTALSQTLGELSKKLFICPM